MDFLSTDIAATPLAKVLEAAWQSRSPFRSAGLHRLNDSVKSATGVGSPGVFHPCTPHSKVQYFEKPVQRFRDLNPVNKCIPPLRPTLNQFFCFGKLLAWGILKKGDVREINNAERGVFSSVDVCREQAMMSLLITPQTAVASGDQQPVSRVVIQYVYMHSLAEWTCFHALLKSSLSRTEALTTNIQVCSRGGGKKTAQPP